MRAFLLASVLTVAVAACSGDTVATTMTSTTMVPLTVEEILADGEVTDAERELAHRAVFDCVVDAGADTTYELFDYDPVVRRDYWNAYNECYGAFIGVTVPLTESSDRYDLSLIGVVECVEDRTGEYFGPKTVDEIGRLTEETIDTIELALNTDRDTYWACEGETRPIESGIEVYEPIIGYEFDDGDPKRISLRVADCGYVYGARLVSESDTTVTVLFIAPGEHLGRACTTRHPIRLKDPLGNRTIIDEATGQPIPIPSA
jgi:hypothetical protein